MVFIRCFLITLLAGFFTLTAKAQTIFYPSDASQLLRSTAADIAMLFEEAIPGNRFTSNAYTTLPEQGIIFSYDSTITDNQACRVESDGYSFIKFSAAEDNGLN